VAELLDAEHPAIGQEPDLLAEGRHHLAARLEVLGAACHDDFGLVLRRLQKRVEVVGRPVVGDPGDQLVEAVEQQHDAALAQHVMERLEVDQLLAVVGEVRRHQPGDRVCLVEGAQLDQDRREMRQLGGDPAGHLVQGEGLAPPEVAQDEDEPAVVGGQQPHHLAGEVVAHAVPGPVELPEPLWHVQAGGIAPVAAQPGRLRRHVVGQVEQPLELGEAAQPQPAPQRVVAQGLRRRRPLVDQLGAVLKARRVHMGEERVDLTGGERAHMGADEELPDEAVLGMGDEQVRRVARHSADLGPLEAGLAHLDDAVEQQVRRAGRHVRLSAGFSAGLRAGGGSGRALRPPQAPAVRQDLGVAQLGAVTSPAAQTAGGHLDDLVAAGGERRQARQPVQVPHLLGPAPAVTAVQEKVEAGAEQALHRGGVAESGTWRMSDRPDAQPAFVPAQPLGEPGRLGLPDEAVVVLLTVAHRDRGVQPGDDGPQLGHLEQRPGLGAVEGRAVQALVDLLEEGGEVPPLRPVRRPGAHVVGLAGREVRPARGLGHVPRPGDDEEPSRFETQQHPKPGQERQRLLALPDAARLGQVAGHHEQVRAGHPGVGQPGQVGPDARLELARVQRLVRLGQPAAEPRPRHMQHGDRRRASRPGRRRERGGGRRGAPRPRRPYGLLGGRGGLRREGGGVEGEPGLLDRLGAAGEGLPDPGEQQPPGLIRVGDSQEVDPCDGGQQPFQRAVLQPDGDELVGGVAGVGAQRRLPLQPAVPGLEVVAGQHGDDQVGLAHAPVHEVDEVGPRHEVPRLEHRAVSRGLELPGDPRRPALVGGGVADEDLRPRVLPPAHTAPRAVAIT
jgi:hypothetical protein